jgi:hypothetical protein
MTPPFPRRAAIQVGVQRQYCGALGKKANCQAAVSLHYVGKQGHVPLALRRFLPESWLAAPARLNKAGVPQSERRTLTKGEIALELLDRVRAEGMLPGRVVVADSGLRSQRVLACGLGCARFALLGGRHLWRWSSLPKSLAGSRRDRAAEGLLAAAIAWTVAPARPLTLREVVAQTPLRKVTWREGAKGPMAGRFAWRRGWPAQGSRHGRLRPWRSPSGF